MYLYYDKNGVLKEIVNDEQLRQYNSNQKIYVYFEGYENYDTCNYWLNWFESSGSTKELKKSTALSAGATVTKSIEFDRKRDLKFFEYNKNYQMYALNVGTQTYTYDNTSTTFYVLDKTGEFKLSVQLSHTTANTAITLGEFVFTVAGSAILPTESVTESQFLYLLSEIAKAETALNNFTASASATAGTTAGVTVTKTGTTTPNLAFSFTLPKGDTGDTGAAAGFGAPTATTTTLAPGSNAQVYVSASGTDIAKIFNFAFSIPRGRDSMPFVIDIITLSTTPIVGTTEFNVELDKFSTYPAAIETGAYVFALLNNTNTSTTYLSILYVVDATYIGTKARCRVDKLAQAGAKGDTGANGQDGTNGQDGADGQDALIVKNIINVNSVPTVGENVYIAASEYNRTPIFDENIGLILIKNSSTNYIYACTGKVYLNNNATIMSIEKVTGEKGDTGERGTSAMCSVKGYFNNGSTQIYSNSSAPFDEYFVKSNFTFEPAQNDKCFIICEEITSGAKYAVIATVYSVVGNNIALSIFSSSQISASQWIGTQSAYNAITVKDPNTLYFIEE